ncbi:MAG: peptidase [Proteobacteria bacterium]|nr:peptidase [Pseudomonadota bacterium]
MRRVLILCVASVLLSCTAHAAPAGARRGPDRLDQKSTAEIRKYTTDPSFLTEWVDHLPASRQVPSPLAFLGYVIGTPGKLTRPERINAYFRRLARTSPRVRIFSLGKSHGGREMIAAAIADPGVLARLDATKRAMRELADPRRTGLAQARQLTRSTVPIYWITAGLHSPETGPPEMVMELAYRLAVSEQDHIRAIRRNVITLLTPVLEMDGRARMVDWYYRYLTGVRELEDSPPRMAPYWGDYTAHDNNRDGLQLSQPLTRNYVAAYHEFLPVASLDLHESVPLLYVSSGTGPYNDTLDPIVVTEWQWMASYEVSQLTQLGLRGVWTWGFYTGWYPGYLLWVTNNHNAIGRFYETFGNSNAGTFKRELRRYRFAERRINSRQWYRAWPPEKELTWSLRNNTNYMQSGVLASLLLVAKNRETLLENFWRKNKNSLDKGKKQPPHAFVIPAEQRDRGNLHHLLWLLSGHRIEVHRARADAELVAMPVGVRAREVSARPATAGKGKGARRIAVKSGDFVVRMDQPYRNFALTLLLKQAFPKTAKLTPYDDVAWSLDYMLGVVVEPIADKAVFDLPVERMTRIPDLPGTVEDSERWIIDHRAQTRLISLRWALPKDARVKALSGAWNGHPAGSLVISGVDRATMDAVASTFHIDARAIASEPSVATIEVDLPRVALFHTWRYTQDSGWARYTLEQLGVPYTLINKDHLRQGGLHDKFDVVILPTQGFLSFQGMVHGIDPKWGPMPYTKTATYPSHGIIDSSPDITGGMGFVGLANLAQFINQGGVLVALGSAGQLVSQGGLAREVRSLPVYGTPGSHVTARIVRPEHPLSWGYPELTYVFRGNVPVYDVREYRRGHVVAQFGSKTWQEADREADRKADIPVAHPTGDRDLGAASAVAETGPGAAETAGPGEKKTPLLLSGLIKKPEALSRKPALLEVPVGKGRVVLFSWNPMHRYQNHHDLAFVGNALLFYNDFPDRVPSREEMRERDRKKPSR